RLIVLGPMVSCPVKVQGRTVGAVAVGFSADLSEAAPELLAHLQRGAEGFEAHLRAASKPAAPATAVKAPPPYPLPDMARTQPGGAAAPGRAQLGPTPVAPPPPAGSTPLIAVARGAISVRRPIRLRCSWRPTRAPTCALCRMPTGTGR